MASLPTPPVPPVLASEQISENQPPAETTWLLFEGEKAQLFKVGSSNASLDLVSDSGQTKTVQVYGHRQSQQNPELTWVLLSARDARTLTNTHPGPHGNWPRGRVKPRPYLSTGTTARMGHSSTRARAQHLEVGQVDVVPVPEKSSRAFGFRGHPNPVRYRSCYGPESAHEGRHRRASGVVTSPPLAHGCRHRATSPLGGWRLTRKGGE